MNYIDFMSIDGDLLYLQNYKAAIQQIFQNQMANGTRYYRQRHQEEHDEIDSMTAFALAGQMQGVVLQGAVFSLCQTIGSSDELTDALSANLEQNDEAEELIAAMRRIHDALMQGQLRIIQSNISQLQHTMQDVTDVDDDIVFILNTIPSSYMIKWIHHTIEVDIQPFKNQMSLIIPDLMAG